MTNTITKEGRALAIVAGAAFVYGGLRIILGDTLTDLSQWTTSVQLTVLTVFGTIAAGHLLNDARRARHWFAAAGFAVLFLTGTSLVVFNSVGRQAESSMLTASQSDAAAERRITLKATLARSEAMLADAQADLARECKTGKGKRCEGIQATISVYEAAIKGHVADLEKLGPQKPIDAKAVEGAKIAALFGADEVKAQAMFKIAEPFLWTLFFEIGSIVSVGFAFRHIPKAITEGETVSDKQIEEAKPYLLPDTEEVPFAYRGAEITPWAAKFFADHGRWPTKAEVINKFPEFGGSKYVTAWRRVQDAKAA